MELIIFTPPPFPAIKHVVSNTNNIYYSMVLLNIIITYVTNTITPLVVVTCNQFTNNEYQLINQ